MTALDRCLNVYDLRAAAKRRLPKAVFEFVDRGSEDGIAVVVCLVNFPLLLFSRIVSRINEGNTSRASEVNLEDYLLVRCPGTMSVICRKHQT